MPDPFKPGPFQSGPLQSGEHPRGLPSDQLDPEAREVFAELGQLPMQRPADTLRRNFYQRLSDAGSSRDWFGWLRSAWSAQPLVPAALTLVLGLAVGTQISTPADDNRRDTQLDALQAQVSALNTTVAMNLMQSDSISDRLSGVQLAAELNDGDVRQALLARASQDRSQSVRSAAVSALGSYLNEPDVWPELERLMLESDQPLLQLALADLIMRQGNENQVDTLITATRSASLSPEVNDYVLSRMNRSSI